MNEIWRADDGTRKVPSTRDFHIVREGLQQCTGGCMNFQFGTVDQYLMRTKGEDLKLILSPPLWMEPRIVMSEPCHAKRKIRNGCCDINKRMMLLKFFGAQGTYL